MLKIPLADAIASLEQALATVPAGLDARSDFFVQWRARTTELFERLFPDDPAPLTQFKEIEFSPRLLTKDDERDEKLKLDACLAGCDAARTLLNRLVHSLSAPVPVEQPVQGEAQTPAVNVDVGPLPPPAAVISGGTMTTRELCAPVRGSLARVLGAWDKGDQDLALMLSAQLLADLTVLSRDEKFKGAFEKVASNALENGAAAAVKSAAPVCVWSVLAAMNELIKN